MNNNTITNINDLEKKFTKPDDNIKSRPLWFWNGPISKEYIETELIEAKKSGYSGVAILPSTGYTNHEYLSEGFFDDYKIAVDKARDLGLKMCIYDEFDFPSGKMGVGINNPFGEFNIKYPNDTSKRLDKIEETVIDYSKGEYVKEIIKNGSFMGAVAIHNATKEITVLSEGINDRCIKQENIIKITDIPYLEGDQRILLFICVKDESNPVVDYLEPEAIKKFIENVHQNYYKHFSKDFGTVIDSVFYDEPRMWGTTGEKDNTIACKMWTPKYNEKFINKFGFSPLKYYPALWEDIGIDTYAARNLLFGFRADLFAEGFFKTINDWCSEHGITFTGHIEGEESINPTGSCGDLLKVFKYQDIPGTDEVFDYYYFENDGFYGRTSKAFKLISSSAFNYDKPLVMTETNGASGNGEIGNLNRSVYRLYKEAFDQFAKGINYFVPHAILSSYEKPKIFPDLSYKNNGNPNYAVELPRYNDFIGRAQLLLQGGRHIADIGVLYPIESLHAKFRFDSGAQSFASAGSLPVPEADYMNIGELLSLNIRKDYTFLHPEVIKEKCSVEGNTLKLNNLNNYEQYKVIIVPGCNTISFEVLNKIKEFYDAGGYVVFTKMLPRKSAEIGYDKQVIDTITAMVGEYRNGPLYTASSHKEIPNINCMYEPASAGDYNILSKWITGGDTASNQWLEVDFVQELSFNKIYIKESPKSITEFKIQYSDNGIWKDCYSGTTINESGQYIEFDTVKSSKARLYIVSADNAFVGINEFYVYNNEASLTFPEDALNKHCCNININGGKTYFIPNANEDILKASLNDTSLVYDVNIPKVNITGGNFSYIHKINYGMDIYYFANSSDSPIDTYIELRGKLTPKIWNPHNGSIKEMLYSHSFVKDEYVTVVKIQLEPVTSVFILNS